jgi:hypothetical protein
MKTNINNKNKIMQISLHNTCYLLLTTCYFFLLAASCLFLVSKPVKAQQVGLSISPPLLEVMIQPGKSITKAYQLTNNSDFDLYLTAKVVPFTPADLSGNIKLQDSDLPIPTSNFFTLQNSNIQFNQPFQLSAGTSQQLVLKVDIPQVTEEKDHYYTLLIEQAEQGEYIGSRHRIKIGSNLLITVSQSGQPRTEFNLAEFSAQPKFADLFDQIEFNLIVENTGQAFFKPDGKIEVYNTLFNRKMAELDLFPENVLVNSSRKIRCMENQTKTITSEVSADFTSEVLRPIACSFSSTLPGKYKAVITSPSNKPLTTNTQHQTYFYLIPFRLILALGLIILIIWQINRKLKLDNK